MAYLPKAWVWKDVYYILIQLEGAVIIKNLGRITPYFCIHYVQSTRSFQSLVNTRNMQQGRCVCVYANVYINKQGKMFKLSWSFSLNKVSLVYFSEQSQYS